MSCSHNTTKASFDLWLTFGAMMAGPLMPDLRFIMALFKAAQTAISYSPTHLSRVSRVTSTGKMLLLPWSRMQKLFPRIITTRETLQAQPRKVEALFQIGSILDTSPLVLVDRLAELLSSESLPPNVGLWTFS